MKYFLQFFNLFEENRIRIVCIHFFIEHESMPGVDDGRIFQKKFRTSVECDNYTQKNISIQDSKYSHIDEIGSACLPENHPCNDKYPQKHPIQQ